MRWGYLKNNDLYSNYVDRKIKLTMFLYKYIVTIYKYFHRLNLYNKVLILYIVKPYYLLLVLYFLLCHTDTLDGFKSNNNCLSYSSYPHSNRIIEYSQRTFRWAFSWTISCFFVWLLNSWFISSWCSWTCRSDLVVYSLTINESCSIYPSLFCCTDRSTSRECELCFSFFGEHNPHVGLIDQHWFGNLIGVFFPCCSWFFEVPHDISFFYIIG